jgi:hypothetical protein
LSAIIDQGVKKAAEDDVKVSWVGWRTDSEAVFITALGFGREDCEGLWVLPGSFTHKEGVVDVVDEHHHVNEMDDGTEHVLFEGESLPFEVDQVHNEICCED